ncbi:MAG TPA: hypothetical protein VMJ10_03455 [Kofleriaceae bacterium]|nr:hypothetical protein [Kofleriaceae bacterium]
MRIGIVAIAIVSTSFGRARADDCTGDAAPSPDCNAVFAMHRELATPPKVRTPGRFALSFGYRSDEFDPSGRAFAVTPAHAVNTIGHFDGSRLEPMRGDGAYLDFRVYPDPRWYAGFDLGAAAAASPDAAFLARGVDMMPWHEATLATMNAVIGARLPLGRISLRSELAAGVHSALLASAAVDAECDAAFVEPRVAVDVWLHPWWAAEGFAGVNLLDRTEHFFGVGLAFHSQAFDGRY